MFRPFVPNLAPPPPALAYPNVRLTFGLEIEFCFTIAKEAYDAHTGEIDLHPNASANVQVVRERLHCVVALLNRILPIAPEGRSLLRDITAEDAKIPSVDRQRWHITRDRGVLGSPEDAARKLDIPLEDAKNKWLHLGVKLESPILKFEDLTEDVRYQLEQIRDNLRWDPNRHGCYTNLEPHFQVHMAFQDVRIPLVTAQNLLCLYGIFELEIATWHPKAMRRHPITGDQNPWCASLRQGMEMETPTKPKRYYTPQEFTNRIYATTSMRGLKAEVYAGEDATPTEALNISADWMTVNVSLQRRNKTLTMEFRQHTGTVDPIEIKWWVLFCGNLFRFAHMLGQTGQKLQDTPPMDRNNSYLKTLTDQSVLDLIGFSEEGKAYFARKREEYMDDVWDMRRALDETVIQYRIRMRAAGWQTGAAMERNIERKKWWKVENQKILDADELAGNPGHKAFKRVELNSEEEVEPLIPVLTIPPPRPPPPPPAGPPPLLPPQSSAVAAFWGTLPGIWDWILHWIMNLTWHWSSSDTPTGQRAASAQPPTAHHGKLAWIMNLTWPWSSSGNATAQRSTSAQPPAAKQVVLVWIETWLSYFFVGLAGKRFSLQDFWLINVVVLGTVVFYGILERMLGVKGIY